MDILKEDLFPRISVIFSSQVNEKLEPPLQWDIQLGRPCCSPSGDASHPEVQLCSLHPNTSPLTRLRQQVGEISFYLGEANKTGI